MKPVGRPKKTRHVKNKPQIVVFSPRGKPGRPDEVNLRHEELEALRLADFGGLKQKEAARHMKISRQSFGRVLQRARKIVSDGLINGKIIRISGGSYKLSKDTKEFLKVAEEEGFIEVVSTDIPKSFIVAEIDKKSKVFLSPISSVTLKKRTGFVDGISTTFFSDLRKGK